jgi:hypothetical protein
MTPLILYRISAALLLLFAMGHTISFLSFKPPFPGAGLGLQLWRFL